MSLGTVVWFARGLGLIRPNGATAPEQNITFTRSAIPQAQRNLLTADAEVAFDVAEFDGKKRAIKVTLVNEEKQTEITNAIREIRKAKHSEQKKAEKTENGGKSTAEKPTRAQKNKKETKDKKSATSTQPATNGQKAKARKPTAAKEKPNVAERKSRGPAEVVVAGSANVDLVVYLERLPVLGELSSSSSLLLLFTDSYFIFHYLCNYCA
jgi:cold shock CspA family protein